jgi:hypothetical protein
LKLKLRLDLKLNLLIEVDHVTSAQPAGHAGGPSGVIRASAALTAATAAAASAAVAPSAAAHACVAASPRAPPLLPPSAAAATAVAARYVLVACGHVGGDFMRQVAAALFDAMRACAITPNSLTYGLYTKALAEENSRQARGAVTARALRALRVCVFVCLCVCVCVSGCWPCIVVTCAGRACVLIGAIRVDAVL